HLRTTPVASPRTVYVTDIRRPYDVRLGTPAYRGFIESPADRGAATAEPMAKRGRSDEPQHDDQLHGGRVEAAAPATERRAWLDGRAGRGARRTLPARHREHPETIHDRDLRAAASGGPRGDRHRGSRRRIIASPRWRRRVLLSRNCSGMTAARV